MTFTLADRVRERSTSTGTGNFILGGAWSPVYQTFASALSAYEQTYYCAEDVPNGLWEIGVGTMQPDGSLARSPIDGTSGTNPVSWPSGTRNVFMTVPASKLVVTDETAIAGSYSLATITVDTTGRIVAATSGTVTGIGTAQAPTSGANLIQLQGASATGTVRVSSDGNAVTTAAQSVPMSINTLFCGEITASVYDSVTNDVCLLTTTMLAQNSGGTVSIYEPSQSVTPDYATGTLTSVQMTVTADNENTCLNISIEGTGANIVTAQCTIIGHVN